jgi:hypothetical protein
MIIKEEEGKAHRKKTREVGMRLLLGKKIQ